MIILQLLFGLLTYDIIKYYFWKGAREEHRKEVNK